MTRSLITFAALLTTCTLTAPAAYAGHHSFCYTGNLCGFDGEAHMVEALVLMEDAYNSHCHVAQRSLAHRARIEILTASREVCDRGARYELLNAYRELTRFVVTYDRCYLDTAAAFVTNAIELSQVTHLDVQHPALLHATHHAPPAVIHRPVVRTTRRVVHHPYSCQRNSIRIGNPHSGFSFRIGF